MKLRETLLFAALNLACCAAVFGAALWGKQLLAPVDLAPTLLGHYGYIDPASDGIPANQHIIDQLTYDLPLQWTIYHAWRRGEIPWWDPYASSGRPLLADAHVSGSDPVRILADLTLPTFELAYNWTRILHFFLGGMGLFLLLRGLGFAPLLAGGLALAGEVASCNALFFAHPWVQASFTWYPWLWLVWWRSLSRPRVWSPAAGALLVAAVFYAGNLQSHAYLPLFALGFVATPAEWSRQTLRRRVRAVAPSLILGGLLALPVLLPELELFRLNHRAIAPSDGPGHVYDGLLSLAAIYPWVLGTFHSLTLSKFSFYPYVGSAAFVLAGFGALADLARHPQWISPRRFALALIGLWFVVVSTPLANVLYPRMAGMPVLGLIVLGAIGGALLMENPARFRRAGPALLAAVVLIPVGAYSMAWWIYPKWLEGRALRMMMSHSAGDPFGGLSARLRAYQAHHFPHEITFGNPETLFAWLSLAMLAGWLFAASARAPRRRLALLLTLNLLAPLLFLHRFVPHGKLEWWHRLQAGGPEQKAVAQVIGPGGWRLGESAPGEFAFLFPANFGHFQGLHTQAGYQALEPLSLAWMPGLDAEKYCDAWYRTPAVRVTGSLTLEPHAGHARFSWQNGDSRPIAIAGETLNRLELWFPAGAAGTLLRTDTFYPGWKAATGDGRPLALNKAQEVFTRVEIPAGTSHVTFSYEPTGWRLGLAGALLALAVLTARIWPATRSRAALPPA
jgi:hypothetical protein